MGNVIDKLSKGVTRDQSLHFRFGIYAGLVIFGLTFILGIILAILPEDLELVVIFLTIILSLVIWFYVSFKSLDRIRMVCNRFNPFLALIVIWGTIGSLSVLTVMSINLITQKPFHQGVGVGLSAGTILLLLIIEYFYKKSRKLK